MHKIYIICMTFIFEPFICVLIPPWTVKQCEYIRNNYSKGQVSWNNTILSLAATFVAFKISVIFVNYLGW